MKKLFLIFLVGMFLIGFGSTWSLTTFNNSLGTENLTFTGNENITRWLSVPDDTILINAYLNLSGYINGTNWSISTAIYYDNNYSISSEGSDFRDIFFGNSGEKMYAIDSNTDNIYQYSLSTPWDISTATYDSISLDVSTSGVQPSLFFKPDGSILYVMQLTGNYFEQYSLSTPWDISTATYEYQYNTYCTDMFFKPDGLKVYCSRSDLGPIYQYSLPVAWNISNMVYDNTLFIPSGQTNSPGSIFMDPSGSKMFLSAIDNNIIYQYSLSTPWNISTATYDGVSIDSFSDTKTSIFFGNLGRYLYILNHLENTIYQLNAVTFITNPLAQINDIVIWNQTGELNSTNSPKQTSNFATTINSYIETATAVAGYYLVPFIFHSDTPGILEYLGLTFNNNGVIENSQTYPSSAIETASETYTANITYDSNNFNVITGELNLNGFTYTGTKSGIGNTVIFTTSATMPSVSTETNFTAYWTISLTDISGTTEYNLTSNNVTVSPINLTLCDATNNVPFWNFTIYNETNLVEVNSSFEATFTVRPTGSTIDNTFSFSDTNNNKSQYDFCISPATGTYVADTTIKLSSTGYVDKFYNYQEVPLSNSTREDSLYMLSSGESTSFIIHVVDVSGSDIQDAEVRVQKYYPGTNQWLTTEIVTTDYAGESIGHLVSEDDDYRFLVYQSGVSTYNSSSTKIACASSPCTVTLVIPLILSTGFEAVEGLTSTLVFNSNANTFTYTYSDTSGDFDEARLYVLRLAPSNATLVVPCNTTKATASGIITCSIAGQVNGTYQANAYITRDNVEFLDKRVNGVLGTMPYDSMGDDGVLWAFFVLIGIIMLGIVRPSLAIIFGTIGLIVLGLIGIINIGAISIVAIVAIAFILLIRVGRE